MINAEKLQITVEENVDDCEYRSENGDLLFTYYTVSFEWIDARVQVNIFSALFQREHSRMAKCSTATLVEHHTDSYWVLVK